MQAIQIARFLAIIFITSCATADNQEWHKIEKPLDTKAKVYGSYTAGCIAGAEFLGNKGDGFISVSNMNRNYGHPELVNIIKELSRNIHNQYDKTLLIGDLAHPRGGPTSIRTSAHRSHQSGLDVDIWYNFAENDKFEAYSVLNKSRDSINKERFGDLQMQTLKEAAAFNKVERILVNPYVKKSMCNRYNNAKWLNKLRPWWGHDKHFHVRLKCPASDKSCKKQAPVPNHSGCGKELDWWFSNDAKKTGTKQNNRKRKFPKLPKQCNDVYLK